MLEALVVLLTFAVIALGFAVRTLFQENKLLRSDLESRLHAIENLEGPFVCKLADAGPAPLRRVLSLGIYLDVKFWVETLQLTAPEMEEMKTRIYLRDDLSKKAAVKDFDKWFYGDIRVRIQEWRGGYTHIEVEYPLCLHEKPQSIHLYDGQSEAELWRFELPERRGESAVLTTGGLLLESNGNRVTLATGGRFGSASFMNPEPARHNIFLTVPLEEGPQAEEYYFTPDRKIETWPDVYSCLPPWKRRYRHVDWQKGVAWDLWINDCDLLTRSEGNSSKAPSRLLAGWRERFAWNDTGKKWYKRIAKMFEDVQETTRAEWPSGDQKCVSCGAISDRSEFRDACPFCGHEFGRKFEP